MAPRPAADRAWEGDLPRPVRFSGRVRALAQAERARLGCTSSGRQCPRSCDVSLSAHLPGSAYVPGLGVRPWAGRTSLIVRTCRTQKGGPPHGDPPFRTSGGRLRPGGLGEGSGLGGLGEALVHVVPVHDVPPGVDEVRLDVLVLQVEGVLPHVEEQQRGLTDRQVALVVEDLVDAQGLGERVVAEDGPAGALDAEGHRGELLLEGVQATERGVQRGLDVTGRLGAARRHVGPEDGVVEVAAQVEGEVLLQLVDDAEVALVPRVGQLLQGGVGALDVGGVVLVVVQLHDLRDDGRGQSVVVVREVGQLVGHGGTPSRGARPIDGELQSLLTLPT
ncbi:hypothetical protein SDC9_94829 [bioreactor metagenome]|uniref:Uncharacterized protein n=1 Tax=bioreactor metagenome TaxID=1076179 RepID=A0A645A4V5_9ZZZZ